MGDESKLIRVVKKLKTKKTIIEMMKKEIIEIDDYLKFNPLSLSKDRISYLVNLVKEKEELNSFIDRLSFMKYYDIISRVFELDLEKKLVDYIRVIDRYQIYAVYIS